MAGLVTPPEGTPDRGYYNSGSTSTGGGSGSSFIGNYTNLPGGITNAGGTRDSAYVREVQPNELASEQLAGLLAPGNRYIDMARSAGVDQANDRGMLNSSISAGNSERSAIQAAAPIAAQDATAFGTAAGQNLDALNTILQTRMNNTTSMSNAARAAGASMYATDASLRNSREQRTEAGIDRQFADYMAQMGYGQQQRMAAFQLGGSLLQNSQSFNNNVFLNAMNNPFMMQDPEALGGFVDFANQGTSDYYNQLFGFAGNGGDNLPQWQENSPWYTSPDFSQEYGDGTYVGGGPQLPYQPQPVGGP